MLPHLSSSGLGADQAGFLIGFSVPFRDLEILRGLKISFDASLLACKHSGIVDIVAFTNIVQCNFFVVNGCMCGETVCLPTEGCVSDEPVCVCRCLPALHWLSHSSPQS